MPMLFLTVDSVRAVIRANPETPGFWEHMDEALFAFNAAPTQVRKVADIGILRETFSRARNGRILYRAGPVVGLVGYYKSLAQFVRLHGYHAPDQPDDLDYRSIAWALAKANQNPPLYVIFTESAL